MLTRSLIYNGKFRLFNLNFQNRFISYSRYTNITNTLITINKTIIRNFSSSNIIDSNVVKRNKDYASKFRDSQEFRSLHDMNLLNIINSSYLIKKEISNIVFMGSNPDLLLQKLPNSNILLI